MHKSDKGAKDAKLAKGAKDAEDAEDETLALHVEKRLVLTPGPAKEQWGLRASIPTLIGLLIIARHDLWPALIDHEGHWTEIITHLGIAFVVSGIVVFGYEWGSDHKKTAALTAHF